MSNCSLENSQAYNLNDNMQPQILISSERPLALKHTEPQDSNQLLIKLGKLGEKEYFFLIYSAFNTESIVEN